LYSFSKKSFFNSIALSFQNHQKIHKRINTIQILYSHKLPRITREVTKILKPSQRDSKSFKLLEILLESGIFCIKNLAKLVVIIKITIGIILKNNILKNKVIPKTIKL
jgi:hypothetical protein